jgi:hypothetical protein
MDKFTTHIENIAHKYVVSADWDFMPLPDQIQFKLEQSLNLNSTDRNQPLSTKVGVRLVDQQFFSVEQDSQPAGGRSVGTGCRVWV